MGAVFVMGLGAGWYPDEHEIYGIDFPPGPERYDRLEEAIALMKELWYSESGTFEGAHYRTANEALARHCEDFGRDPANIRKSMLVFATIGPDEHQEGMALQRFLDMMAPEGSSISLEDAIAAGHGPWRGSVEQLVDHVGQLRDLGLDEVVFEHFCHEDDTIPEWIAAEAKPRLEAF